MFNSQGTNNCLYNLIYTKYNEDFSRTSSFIYDIIYPSFYNFNNGYFFANPKVLNDINSLIKEDAYYFRDAVAKEEKEYNSTVAKTPQEKKIYSAYTHYSVTFNKNHILSVILNLMTLTEESLPNYNALYNYNYDLVNGKQLTIKDIFKDGVDYIKVITDYVNYKISQNKELYFDNVEIFITDDQAFYLKDDGLVIYFDPDQISPLQFGTAKFKLMFSKFAPYIKPRFYCEGTNLKRRMIRR
ncbi:MAG: DUF3298 domain-containing protein [Peptostreptococcaceae bacterium]